MIAIPAHETPRTPAGAAKRHVHVRTQPSRQRSAQRANQGRKPRPGYDADAELGSAVVAFALVAVLAVTSFLAVAQLAMDLWTRNVVMGSLAEGARIAAKQGGSITEGEQRAQLLIDESVPNWTGAIPVTGADLGDRVTLHAHGQLPSLVPGIPGLALDQTATIHKETSLVPLGPAPAST